MKNQVKNFVRTCNICQHHKSETLQPADFLQPLSIPIQIWIDIALDFIGDLPNSRQKCNTGDCRKILKIYPPLPHLYMTVRVAHLFFHYIFKLHGFSEPVVSNFNVTFTSAFWTELFHLYGTKLALSCAYDPQWASRGF